MNTDVPFYPYLFAISEDMEHNINMNIKETQSQKALNLVKKKGVVRSSEFVNEGDVVFDPMMGSGTTGVACKSLNRKFIGVEKEENYFNIAKERIDKS